MKNFKFFRYLLRDKVDFIFLLVIIALLISDYDIQKSYFAIFIIYIIGVMMRMGMQADIINNNVTVPALRHLLKLPRIIGDVIFIRKTTFAKIVDVIFWLGTIGILVYVAFFDK